MPGDDLISHKPRQIKAPGLKKTNSNNTGLQRGSLESHGDPAKRAGQGRLEHWLILKPRNGGSETMQFVEAYSVNKHQRGGDMLGAPDPGC